MIYSVEHLFICLFAVCILSLVRCVLRSLFLSLVRCLLRYLARFKIGSFLFSYFLILRDICVFWITVLYQICLFQIFSPTVWLVFSFFFFFFLKLILFFLSVLGLRCCVRAFSSCGERGLLFVAVRGLLIAVASLCCGARAVGARASVVVARGLSSCGARA